MHAIIGGVLYNRNDVSARFRKVTSSKGGDEPIPDIVSKIVGVVVGCMYVRSLVVNRVMVV
jgi:hypothetical protein